MALPFELQPSETVLRICRRHWMHLYPRVALQVAIGVLPIIVLTTLTGLGPGLNGGAGFFVLILDVLWALYWGIRVYFTFYRYNNDIWVITDQRLVDSLRRHWFHHSMASADLIDVEDIAVQREGILQTMFNYGDLRCQTAGAVANFILSGIPEPSEVLAIVDSARDAARKARSAEAWNR